MCDREGGLAFVHNKNLMYSFTKISLDCIYILLHQTIWLHFLDLTCYILQLLFTPCPSLQPSVFLRDKQPFPPQLLRLQLPPAGKEAPRLCMAASWFSWCLKGTSTEAFLEPSLKRPSIPVTRYHLILFCLRISQSKHSP